MKFTKDPSSYLYGKIKEDINNKFIKVMDKENIYELNNNFNHKIKKLSEDFISKIKEANKKLFNIEYQKLKNNLSLEVNNEFANLCKYNSNNISFIKNKKSQNGLGEYSNMQLSDDEINNLNDIQSKLLKYENYAKREGEERLVYYTLSYDFTKIKKPYDLLYLNKYLELDKETHKGKIFIINDKIDDEFKNKFKIEINKEPTDVIKGEDKKDINPENISLINETNIEDEVRNLKGDDVEDKEKTEYKIIKDEDKKDEDVKDKGKVENEIIKDEVVKNEDIKDEEIGKDKAENKVKLQIEIEIEKEDVYNIENYIDFKNAKKSTVSTLKIQNEEEIKNSIEKDMKIPTEEDVINPPEILLSVYKVDEFSV